MRGLRFVFAGGALGIVAGFGPSVPAPTLAAPGDAAQPAGCNTPQPAGWARCHAHVQPAASGPSGYGPADLMNAYALSDTGSGARTIAIVDAFDDPNAESDLAVYRSQFSLPACTTANGCFSKIDQNGGTRYPRPSTGWAEEISLDLDMVSAICPSCHILLVEAKNNFFSNLAAAVDRAAATPGVVAISNSYGGSEYSSEVNDEVHYNHAGLAVTVSSGDNGYGAEFPASSQYVTAVGGTSLTRSSGVWSETAWSGAGSGCSAYIAKPSWQLDTGCSRRTVADVSAVADPNTGVAVYDSFHEPGWLQFGGTSVSSPIIAAIHGLNTGTYAPSNPYSHRSALNDVISGSNGNCGGSYLCTAGAGYDGPTGLGTPKGAAAF